MVTLEVREIPDTPQVLEDDEYWNYYCQQLQDEGRLYKKDLSAIKTLCFWEEERDKLLETIKEEGLTEKAGSKIRRNGAHTTIEKVERSIKSLRKELDVAPHWSSDSKENNNGYKIPDKNF